MKKFEAPEMKMRMFVTEKILTASGNEQTPASPTQKPIDDDYIIGPGAPNLPPA